MTREWATGGNTAGSNTDQQDRKSNTEQTVQRTRDCQNKTGSVINTEMKTKTNMKTRLIKHRRRLDTGGGKTQKSQRTKTEKYKIRHKNNHKSKNHRIFKNKQYNVQKLRNTVSQTQYHDRFIDRLIDGCAFTHLVLNRTVI